MGVEEDGGLAGRVLPVCVDQGMSRGGNQFDVLEAGFFQAVGDELGCTLDVIW